MFYSFFAGEGAKYYIGVEERNCIPKEEYEDKVFLDFVSFALDYAKQHKEKKYIIDGIWIYLYFDDPSVFKNYAVFIKGTSFLKSKIRVMKRERQRDKEELHDRKQMFERETRNYLLDEDKIDSYRSFFGACPETIYREETNEAAKIDEFIIHELNSIDRCFVNNDADGIYEILKKAEANAELSNLNKLRIINECISALFDLRIGAVIDQREGDALSLEEKRHQLYLRQKALSEAFLERRATSREQLEKTLHDLAVKMGKQ